MKFQRHYLALALAGGLATATIPSASADPVGTLLSTGTSFFVADEGLKISLTLTGDGPLAEPLPATILLVDESQAPIHRTTGYLTTEEPLTVRIPLEVIDGRPIRVVGSVLVPDGYVFRLALEPDEIGGGENRIGIGPLTHCLMTWVGQPDSWIGEPEGPSWTPACDLLEQ